MKPLRIIKNIENVYIIDLIEINQLKEPPFLFDLNIKISNLNGFEISIIEVAISEMYKLQESYWKKCPETIEIANQKFTREQYNRLNRWELLKKLSQAIRDEIKSKEKEFIPPFY